MKEIRPKAWKALLHRVRHLALELDDRQELTETHAPEFIRLVQTDLGEPATETTKPDPSEVGLVVSRAAQEGPEVPPRGRGPTEDSPAPENDDAAPPDAARKLWRAVAVATHPDKVGSDGELGQLYRRASAAWQDRNWSELVGVGLELGLTIEPDQALYEALMTIRDKSERKLAQLEDTALWQWIVSEDEDRKTAIVRDVSQQMKAKKNAPSA